MCLAPSKNSWGFSFCQRSGPYTTSKLVLLQRLFLQKIAAISPHSFEIWDNSADKLSIQETYGIGTSREGCEVLLPLLPSWQSEEISITKMAEDNRIWMLPAICLSHSGVLITLQVRTLLVNRQHVGSLGELTLKWPCVVLWALQKTRTSVF